MKKLLSLCFVLLIMLFTFFGCENSEKLEEEKETVIAKVNDKEITLTEYNKNIIIFGGQYESVFGKEIWNKEIGDGMTYRESFKKEMFDKMVTQELVLQGAKTMGIQVSQQDIDNELLAFKEKNENNIDFQNILSDNAIDDNFLKSQFEYELYGEKYKSLVLESSDISDEVINNYYDANTFRFANEELKASHILLKTVDDNFKALSDADIENKLAIAETVLNKLRQGASFEDMAMQYSEDITTAQNGGDLGYFRSGDMAQEFEDAAFALEVGEFSEIIKTIHGYHIIKVYDKVQEIAPLEEVKDGIIAKLQMDIFDVKIKELYDNATIQEYRELIEKTGEDSD